MDEHEDRVRGRAVARAVLGRSPDDHLEAATVLEAWGGVVPPTSLRVAEDIVDVHAADDAPSGHLALPAGSRQREPLAVLLVLVGLLAWSDPLIAVHGPAVFDTMWTAAVPITLAVQWWLHRRYLVDHDGAARLRHDGPTIVTVAVLLPAAAGMLAGTPGLLGSLVVVIWSATTVLGTLGGGLVYALLVASTAVGLQAGLPPTPTVSVIAATGLAASASVTTARAGTVRARPVSGTRALATGGIGGGLGLMLVVDGLIQWFAGWQTLIVLLVPSVGAGLLAAAVLARVWQVVPRALHGHDRLTDDAPARRAVGGLLARAAVAFAATLGVLLSLASVLPWTDGLDPVAIGWVVAGLALAVCATVVVGFVDALEHPGACLTAVGCGLSIEVVVVGIAPSLPSGSALALGSLGIILWLGPTLGRTVRGPSLALARIVAR